MEIDQGHKQVDLSHNKNKKGKKANAASCADSDVEKREVNKKVHKKKLCVTEANVNKHSNSKSNSTSRIHVSSLSGNTVVESEHLEENTESLVVGENTAKFMPHGIQECNSRTCETGGTIKKNRGQKQESILQKKDKKHYKNKNSVVSVDTTYKDLFDTQPEKQRDESSILEKLQGRKPLESKKALLELEAVSSTDKVSRSKKRRFRKRRVLGSFCVVNTNEEKSLNVYSTKRNKLRAVAVDINRLSGNADCHSELEGNCRADTLNGSCKKVKTNGLLVLPGVEDSFESLVGDYILQDSIVERAHIDIISDAEDKLSVASDLHNFSNSESSRACGALFYDTCVPLNINSSTANNSSLHRDFDHYSVPNIKSSLGDEIVNLPSRSEENFCDKASVPNFFAHDNVEGLFRSALLNDITLSSRCSEKEVKNFFNTYGTFSEKNRSQFAEVEKLLLSGSKGNEASSELFETNPPIAASSSESTSGRLRSTQNHSGDITNDGTNPTQISKNSRGVVKQVKDTEGSTDNSCVRSNCVSCTNYSSSSLLGKLDEISLLNTDIQKAPISTRSNPVSKVTNSVDSTQFLSENKNPVTSPSTNLGLNNSVFLRPDKSESRLLEIVENVLLEHEKVREQLTSDKKSTLQKYSQSCSQKDLSDLCVGTEVEETHTSFVDKIQDIPEEEPHSPSDKSRDPPWDAVSSVPLPECDLSPEATPIPIVGPQPQAATMQKTEKSRDEVKAEREAKKAAKLARKQKPSGPVSMSTEPGCPVGNGAALGLGEASDSASRMSKVTATLSVDSDSLVAAKQTEETSISSGPEQVQRVVDTVDGTIVKSKGGPSRPERPQRGIDTVDGTILRSKGEPSRVVDTGDFALPRSKADLRAERRAKQEAQRVAKQQQRGAQQPQVKAAEACVEKPLKPEVPPAVTQAAKLGKAESGKDVLKPATQHKVKLFSHLYIKQEPTIPRSLVATSHLHPSIVRLGVQYATKVVVGSNARCLALLHVMKQVIEEYETPPQKEFSRGLEATLQPCMAFLQECRPLSVSMINALKHLKWQMRHLPNSISDGDAKKKLQEAIDTYVREQIEVAGQAICNTVLGKISSGDVILTYGCSSLLQRILIKAHKTGTKFQVVVVDGRPWREGKEMLRRLIESGLRCSYVGMTAASFIMREVTKVFLGAHALLANGYVMSRAGSSQVALLAHSYNVPVLVCCETHKFSERVHTDSIVYNELGPPDELVVADSCTKEHPLSKWRCVNHLTPLNITYDVTPPHLVTAVVTELAILPCTSVPVILRIKPTETGC